MTQTLEDKKFVEKLRSIQWGRVKGGTPKFSVTREDVYATIHPDNPCREIVKDPVKFKAIIKGNPSDKSLTRDCTAIGEERSRKKNEAWKTKKLEKIRTMKEKFKAKYGYLP